jgi:hypothetical protein
VTDENGLEVGNDCQPSHYWTTEDNNGESVIHVVLANRLITKWLIPADEHPTKSDHEVIEWEVDVDR